MKHDEILIYGLLNGTKNKLVHIDVAENGKECNCECPNCHAPLVARNGGKGGRYRQNIHHFAHASGYEPCGKGSMSALHILAQQIIKQEKKVMLPAYDRQFVKKSAEQFAFEDVELEVVCTGENSTRRPDCIGTPYNDASLWIEIYCCNPINQERREDINQRKQYCIEIDFSNLLETDYTEDVIRKRLLDSHDDREWICHPVWDKEEEDREKEEQRKQEEARRKLMEEARQREEEQRKAIAEALQKGAIKMVQEPKTETPTPQVTWHISEPKEKHSSTIPDTSNRKDWVMYAKSVYWNENALDTFYDLLSKEYTKVTLENSHPLVSEELHLKVNELLPRTHLIEKVNKIYLELLLAIWILDKINHSGIHKLGKVFVENQNLRNNLFRVIKQIGSINKREIEDTLALEDEQREVMLQILRICYK